ncbi:hypothetical protein LJC46_08085, partial [Desulfovibrio sp. OttesenSCG-928-G15]|nr:hypothetical protein [Desulfovibrio sp. OttesenSCG-928-G15]
MPRHNVLVIVFADNACARLGVVFPFERLEEEGTISTRMFTSGQANASDVDWADIVVLQRVFSHLDMDVALEARRQGKPVVYDIDDNLLDVPLGLGPIAELYAREDVRHNIKTILRMADLVKTSTAPLAEILTPIAGKKPLVLSPMNHDEMYAPVRRSQDGV